MSSDDRRSAPPGPTDAARSASPGASPWPVGAAADEWQSYGRQPAAATADADAAVPHALALADGQAVALGAEELTIGRAPTNDIVVDDPQIAAHHARLQRFPTGWVLTPLAEGDGTTVNGQPLTRPVFLAPGDTIRLGRLDVTFTTGGQTRRAASPSGILGASPDLATAEPPGAARLPPGAPLIRLANVVKTYPTRAGPLAVLRGVSLTVQPGEFVAIVGPSGCGKSTLLNVLTGIDQPDSGEVMVGGEDLRTMPSDALVGWRGRNVGIVFQFFQLLPTLTVVENVMLPMALCKTYRGREQRARAMEVLGRVSMAHMADRLPNALSGGEQQRVAIARALANNPALIVADEPTGNLDGRTGRQIFELFVSLVDAGTTVIMVTHDAALAGRAARRVEMSDGSIVELTAPEPPAEEGYCGTGLHSSEHT